MTIGEIIKKLSIYPEDMEVIGESDKSDYPMDIHIHDGYYNPECSEWTGPPEDGFMNGVKVVVIHTSN